MWLNWRGILLAFFLWFKIAFSAILGEITITGYKSTSSVYTALNDTITKKLIDSILYVTTFTKDDTGIMSRTSPDVILFFQLIHSVMKDDMILTNLVIDISNEFKNDKKRKNFNSVRKENYRVWLETFNFPKDEVFNFVKKVARVKLKIPSIIADQIFLLDNKHKVINRCFIENDFETIQWFLDSGYPVANISFTDLEAAFHKGNIDILKRILKHKYFKESTTQLSVDSHYSSGQTFLHLAVQFAELDEIEALIKYSININSQDSSGATPIYRAIEANRVNVVQKLIENSADLNSRYGDEEDSLLHLAAQLRQAEILSALLAKVGPDIKNKNGDTPIHFAAKNFSTTVFSALFKAKADIHVKNNLGETPLHIAAFFGSIQAVQALLSKSANVKDKDDEGFTPIMKAALKRNVDVINLLLKVRTDLIYTKTDLGTTIMHIAVETGDATFVRWLISVGAEVNEKNNLLQLPLYVAALRGDTNIINALKEKTDLKSNNNGLNMLHQAVISGNLKAVKGLLSAGIHINSKGLWGMTALHYAASRGHDKLVVFLIQNKADINSKSKTVQTPLHYAVMGKNRDTVEILMDNCANYQLRDSNQRTALDLADEYSLRAISIIIQRKRNACQ